MGLPTSGVVYVDSACIIYTVEPHPVYAPLLRPLWRDLAAGRLTVVTSDLTSMEVLVGAIRAGDPVLEADYRRTLDGSAIRLLPMDQAVLTQAARFRASQAGLRTPDAIHVATAELSGCTAFITNDKGLRNAPSKGVVILDDL